MHCIKIPHLCDLVEKENLICISGMAPSKVTSCYDREFKLFKQFPCSLLQVVMNFYNLGLCVANMHVDISLVI